PDLTITDIWWDLENPKIGDELTFSYTVKNQGTVDTIAEFNNVLYIDGERYDQSARGNLAAEEIKDMFFPHRWTATAGDHTIKVIADGYGDIDESDETNNASIKTLEIVNLEGRVISDSSDDGIYDVSVTITPGGMTATTPPNGYYSFKDISEGKYTITASKQGYTFNSVTVSVSKDTTTTAPTIIGSIDRSINAEIVQEPKREDLDGTYIIGSRVPVSYTIKNTGEIEHTFYAGFSVRDKFNKYWDAPYEAVTLGKGDTMEVTLSWIVQEDVTVDHSYDVIIAVWAAQQNSYLYDNLARKEYKDAFKIISGGTHVSGWYLYMEDQREVTVEGKVYTAIPATSHGSRSWLIKNKNGNVEQDLEMYKRAAEAASISESITPRTVSFLREIKSDFHNFFYASFFGVRTILWIRDTGSWLLGKFIVIAATGGSSIGKDLPTGDVLKFAAHEIAEQYKSKLIGDLTNLPRTKLTEKTIKKIFWEATVQNIRISADKLDDAINVIENHNEGEPWSYQEAHTYYTNYKEAVLIGMSSMDLTMGLQPGSDLGHQVVDIGIGVLDGATSIKFDEVLAVDVYKKFKDFKEFEQSAIVYLKYKEMFDEMELEFGTTAEQIQKDALKTPSISGTIKCPADIHAYDSQGRHVGLNPTGGNDLEISGAYYSGHDSEPESIVIFGQSDDIIFKINALDLGEFDFTLIQNSETETTTVTYLDVPIIQTTEATVDVSERNPTYTMEIDDDGDGTTDWTKEPDSIETTGTESPKLCTSPDPPTTNFGTVPQNQTRTWDFFITNCGSGTLTWAITCDQSSWLNVNPVNGSTTALDVVTVTIDTHDLSPGTHTGQITITSNGGEKTGTITVNVPPPAQEPKLCTAPDPPTINFGTVAKDQTRTWD
ncbi:MAG: CARDB domain-containing protein, partial [Patescibacteria group bacterium]|nr:CARDB domain-containing protein [Patescibacteria group bacterium]